MSSRFDPNERARALAALERDPTNIQFGWDYVVACAETLTARDVAAAFNAAARASDAGVLALAEAHRELFEVSGEPPRWQLIDPLALARARAMAAASSRNDDSVGWFVRALVDDDAYRQRR